MCYLCNKGEKNENTVDLTCFAINEMQLTLQKKEIYFPTASKRKLFYTINVMRIMKTTKI